MFRSVLAAADFRRQPDPAVVNGARLAGVTGGRLHVVHVSGRDGGEGVVPESVREDLPAGSTLTVREGIPHEVVTEEAVRVEADVVVLGPRVERSPITGLLGTTADRVIRASRVPCLLSNAPLAENPQRILLAMDRSAPAREALRVCTGLARELVRHGGGVSIHLLNVSAFAQPGRRWGPGWIDLRKYAEKTRAAVGSEVAVTHGVFSAPFPAEGILDCVRSSRPELLIMGTHGLGAIGRLLMGSVARGVVREATVPVLLVPPRASSGRFASAESPA